MAGAIGAIGFLASTAYTVATGQENVEDSLLDNGAVAALSWAAGVGVDFMLAAFLPELAVAGIAVGVGVLASVLYSDAIPDDWKLSGIRRRFIN